jgi:hypothetical protein
MAHIIQSTPDSGLGFKVKITQSFYDVPCACTAPPRPGPTALESHFPVMGVDFGGVGGPLPTDLLTESDCDCYFTLEATHGQI